MKIAFLADLHINTGTYGGADKDGLTFRMRDFMDAFSWAVTAIVDEVKPDAVVILGDIYDHPHPPNNVRRFFNSQISKLSSAGISVHILVGNHDACKLHHALEPLEGIRLPNVSIYYSPTVVDLGSIDKNAPIFFVFPHSERVERREIGMRDYFLETLETWRPQIANVKLTGRHPILLGHFPIKGAFVQDGVADTNAENISCDDIDLAGVEYGFFGDFHSMQKLQCKTNAMYVGSLERSNFNDMSGKKGFVVYDNNKVESPILGAHVSFVENVGARPMRLIKGDWDYINSQLEIVQKTSKDSIVKIHFQGDRSQYDSFDREKDKIKKAMSSAGAKLVLTSAQIVDSTREQAAIKIQEEIRNMDNVEFEDIDQVVKTALDVNSKTPEESKAVLELAHDIMKSVRSRRAAEAGSVTSGTVRIHGVRGHNFQRFGEKANIIEFDKGAKYFLDTGIDELPQWQKEDFHRKGKAFLDNCLSVPRRKIISITGMTDGDPLKSNGSGKSTVIEMISYALYEKRAREYVHKFGDREKGKSTTSIMREKDGVIACQETFVDLLFSVDSSLWILRRGRKLSGKGSTKHDSVLELHCITSDGFVYSEGSHGGHRGDDANTALAELIRMPFETFCNSLLFGQNDAGQFLVGTDKTRKEIIINILQLAILNEYLEETRRLKKLVDSEMVSLKAQIDVLLDGAEAKELELVTRLSVIEKEQIDLEKTLADINNRIAETSKADALLSLERAKADLEAKAKALSDKSNDMDKDKSNLKIRFEKSKANHAEKELAVKQIKERIDKEKVSLSSLEALVAAYSSDSVKKQMSLIESAKKAKPERDSQIERIQASLNAILPTLGELQGAVKERKEELASLKVLKDKCETGGQVQCSKCRQLVGAGHIEAEIVRLSSEISVKEQRASQISQEKDAFETEAKEVRLKLQNIEKYTSKEAELVRGKQEQEDRKAKVQDIKNRVAVAEQDLLAAGEALIRASEDQGQISGEIDKISNDRQKALAPYVSDKEKAEMAVRSAKEAVEQIKKDITKLEEEAKVANGNIKSKASDKAKTEAGIEAVRTSISKSKKLSDDLSLQSVKMERLKTLDWVFGSDGAQVHIIEKYMPLLNHHLQEFLDIISDGTVRASVITDGKKEGKVELAITGELSSVTDGLSGGESVKLRLALDMALGMLSLTRANGTIDSIYIDEAIAPVDMDSKDRIFELLDKLQEHFRTVVIVSHDPSLQERIKETVVIDKVDGISTVKRQFYEREDVITNK
jgi:DNA repair exonuclease SbcCD ATPase subunit/DNA repair exonuclease SbcCD nuclease subunit